MAHQVRPLSLRCLGPIGWRKGRHASVREVSARVSSVQCASFASSASSASMRPVMQQPDPELDATGLGARRPPMHYVSYMTGVPVQQARSGL